MTKKDLAVYISKHNDVSASMAQTMIEIVVDAITECLEEHNNIYIRGFATLGVKHTKAKPGRSFTKDTPIVIPAKTKPFVKFCSEIINKVNHE